MAQIFAGQIRFGVHAGPQHTAFADYAHLWKTVEGMGYDWASVFDHFLPIFADPTGPCFEGPTLLSAMAAQTSRIRCGILVIGNTYRNPAVLANIAATIDHVSGGRLEWGIGAGWYEMEHQQYNIPYPPIGRRIRMLGETARIQKLLWTEPRTTFAGRYYQLTDALCEPKPVQRHLRPQLPTETPAVVAFQQYARFTSIDSDENRRRFYALSWQPSLFDGGLLVRSWGRVSRPAERPTYGGAARPPPAAAAL